MLVTTLCCTKSPCLLVEVLQCLLHTLGPGAVAASALCRPWQSLDLIEHSQTTKVVKSVNGRQLQLAARKNTSKYILSCIYVVTLICVKCLSSVHVKDVSHT